VLTCIMTLPTNCELKIACACWTKTNDQEVLFGLEGSLYRFKSRTLLPFILKGTNYVPIRSCVTGIIIMFILCDILFSLISCILMFTSRHSRVLHRPLYVIGRTSDLNYDKPGGNPSWLLCVFSCFS